MSSKTSLLYKVIIGLIIIIGVGLFFAGRPRAYTPMISNTATLNFPSTVGGSSSDLTMTLTGAALNDVVILGVPNGSVPVNGGFFAWVSSSNTISVRYFNNDLVTSYDPASGTYRATIVKP